MGVNKIPGYGYFGSNNRQMNFSWYSSDTLRDRLLGAGIEYTITGTAAEQATENTSKVINKYLGEELINKFQEYYVVRDSDLPAWILSICELIGNINITQLRTLSSTTIGSFKTLNGKTIDLNKDLTSSISSTYRLNNDLTYLTHSNLEFSQSGGTTTVRFNIPIYPDNIFLSGGVDEASLNKAVRVLRIIIVYEGTNVAPFYKCTSIRLTTLDTTQGVFQSQKIQQKLYEANFELRNSMIDEEDTTNPYSNHSGSSTTGGGDGEYPDIDNVDPVDFPSLPAASAADLGFVTIYNPSAAQIKQLSTFMWSGLFDLDTYKKLFSDPMESIIGLAIVPVAPSVGGSKNVMFGTIDSGVSMPYLTTQYVKKNCGSVNIEKYVGSFLDAAPYTKISIFLPFIGIHEISPDDVMGGSITVEYNIDVLSGACCAMIKHSSRGVLYSYNGSCISNIPLSAINFSNAIQNAVSAVCSGAAMVAGMATGAAPMTAMGAVGLASAGANAALNSKPSVQRSGSLGGSAGIMGVLKPYVIIERPDVSVPADAAHFVGQTCNITNYLGNFSGFTMVEAVHLNGINATSQEIAEIDSLLKQGVML